jgi:hypothetical protein
LIPWPRWGNETFARAVAAVPDAEEDTLDYWLRSELEL